MRWDYEKTPSYLDFVTPANFIAALNSPNNDPNAPAGQTYAQCSCAGGMNVNDYISDGHNRDNRKMPSRRVSASHTISSATKQHTLHGGAGRSYDRNLFEILQLEQTKASLSELTLTFPNQFHTFTPGPNCLAYDPAFMDLATLQAMFAGTTTGNGKSTSSTTI